MSQPFKLFRLQQIDSQLDQARSRLQEIDNALNRDEALRQALNRTKDTEESLNVQQKILRRAEEDVKSQRLKIEQTEATLYGGKVKNPKELQDMQNEAAALKRYLSVLEDRQLEAMLAVDEAEAEHKSALDHLEQVRAQMAKRNKDLTAEQADLLQDVDRMEAERQAAISGIPDEDLNLYDALRKQRRGIAVAKVSDKTCAACGSTLSSALLHAARSPSQITRCERCGRILYAG
jgi:predicted  nucleic acid-binding Zn-ribbon protein